MKLLEVLSKSFENEKSIEDTIKNLHNLPKELKDFALEHLNSYTKAGKGRAWGLTLHKDLKKKIKEKGLPSGFDMGVDKNGYYIHTHRARCKSHEKPDGITVTQIKFIDSTG